MWLAPLLLAALVAAGCGSDDETADPGTAAPSDSAEQTEQSSTTDPAPAEDPPTSAETTTDDPAEGDTENTEDTETAPASQAFAAPPGSCLELPALLANLPKSGFFVMTEDRIFECLGVSSFQSSVSFDGNLPERSVSVVADSTQRLDGGAISAEALTTEDGVTTENLIRVGDDVWLRNESGDWEPTTLDLGYLFSEQGEARLSMSGALYALSVYGGGAQDKGEVEIDGRTLRLWEATADDIADYVNTLGIAPVPVGITDGFVNIWTTQDGLIVKLEGEIRAENVTLAGIPTTQVDPVALGLPADALDIVPDYAMSYELFNFDHDIEITAPQG